MLAGTCSRDFPRIHLLSQNEWLVHVAGNCSLDPQVLINANRQISNPDLVSAGTPVCVPSACCTRTQCAASDPTLMAAAPASGLTGMRLPPLASPPTSITPRRLKLFMPLPPPFPTFGYIPPPQMSLSYAGSRPSALPCLPPPQPPSYSPSTSLVFACFAPSLQLSCRLPEALPLLS